MVLGSVVIEGDFSGLVHAAYIAFNKFHDARTVCYYI